MESRYGMRVGLALSVAVLTSSISLGSLKPEAPRRVVSLDGSWQVSQGAMDSVPASFPHVVPVPGLLDLAEPAFQDVGKPSPLREAFWYRREFSLEGAVPQVAILKIHKARYTSRVYVNGQLAGDHLPCFTPAYLDVRRLLKGDGQANEIVVRVGANREHVPDGQPSGWDFEKYLYIPGIYDSVELILTDPPYIVNAQAAPDVSKGVVRIVAEVLAGDRPCQASFRVEVSETQSGRPVGSAAPEPLDLAAGEMRKIDVTVAIDGCRLWSPEDPFLYEAKLGTGSDSARFRFGMRSFSFDPEKKIALLNGKPYFLRGTNVTAYRFFEDASRADLPWRADWVRQLHQTYKTMHWNSIRYCIGFPPEIWYDIADEEGFLIQDEFPIWLLGKAPENPTTDKIVPEYVAWMRERWNHPCVVIWDGQNESHTDQTGAAIKAVRSLDLSGRPWENGWADPQSSTDCVESHPYLFIRTWTSKGKEPFLLKEMANVSGVPALNPAQKKHDAAILINEYDWLWLTRDGNPTCLTQEVFESLLGKESTVAQRRLLRARYVAALTEFWRAHRQAAGVLHFCGLGYSRPGDQPRPEGGATSDDFVDLENLTFEPSFAEYVGESFNPLGLMLDFWADTLPSGDTHPFRVHVVNDVDNGWEGDVRLRVSRNGQSYLLATETATVAPLGKTIVTLTARFPDITGPCTLVAELTDSAGRRVRSLRDVTLTKPPSPASGAK